MDENHLIDVIDVYKQIDLKKELIQQETKLESDGDDDLPEVADPDNHEAISLYEALMKRRGGIDILGDSYRRNSYAS
ncbi:hypothetical protein Tco_0502319 [Tanacetum coccineum]